MLAESLPVRESSRRNVWKPLAFLVVMGLLSTGVTTEAHAQSGSGNSTTKPGEPNKAERGRAAKAQYDEGERAFKKGDFRRAGELFEAAYRIFPHHSALWAAARAWIRAGEDVRGANLLEQYLNSAPANAPDRDLATQVITDLDKRLGRIEILMTDVADVKIDGEELTAQKLWVVPGEHVVTADAKGKPVRKTVAVAAGDRLSVTMEPPPPPPAFGEPPPAVTNKPIPPWLVFVGAGVTAVGAGLSIASGLDTLGKRDAFIKEPTQPALDDAHASQTRTNVLIGTTVGVAVLTGVAAFFVDWSGKSKVAPAPTVGFASSGLRVRFP